MKSQLDRPMKYLYGATLVILMMGLCFSVAGPLFQKNQAQVAAKTVVESQTSKDPILQFTEERIKVREIEQRELKQIMEDADADASLKAQAGQRLLSLLSCIEQETTIEGVLRIRGFRDPVASVHQDSANVIVRAAMLTREQSAQVLELVARETGLTGGSIKIIPIP